MESPLNNVGGWLARRASWAPSALAVADDARRLDYASLESRSARCARRLHEAGVVRGDRVAILLDNRSAYLETVFAAARLGALAVPVNARWSQAELAYLLDDCEPRVVVHGHDHADRLAAACGDAHHTPTLCWPVGGEADAYEDSIARSEPWPSVEPVSADDAMMIMYTSGTTGSPKGALLPHRKALYNSLNAQLFFGLSAADRVLVSVPLFHSFGLAILSLPTLYAGGSLVLQARFDADGVWSAVASEGIHVFGGVPTMFRRLHDRLESLPKDHYDLSSLRFLFTAGAAMPVDLIRRYEARGLLVKQGFGQTETSILCCLDARDAVRKAGAVGRPVFHAELRLVRLAEVEASPAEWEDAPPGETGEIVVRGPICMLGYWNRPDETAATLRDGWLRTGDLARADREGFLTLVGRARDMYISGGENVYAREVESVLEQHPAIDELAIVGVPDDEWGEVGHAFVVVAPQIGFDPEAVLDWAGSRLARFKLPRHFTVVASLPRTETGKVRKHVLRGRLGSIAHG